MSQSDKTLWDVEVDDPTIEAALTALIAAEEMLALAQAETEALHAETRQIRTSNRALAKAADLTIEAAHATLALAKRWR